MRFLTFLVFFLFLTICISACNEQDGQKVRNYNGLESEQPTNEIVQEPIQKGTELQRLAFPFYELSERWNALSDKQNSDLYIASFEMEEVVNGEAVYRHTFSNGFILRVFIENEETIRGMHLQGQVSTEEQRYTLLTGWSQIVLLSNLNFDTYDVNRVFDGVGIGPNATILEGDREVHYQGIYFKSSRTNNDFLFEAEF